MLHLQILKNGAEWKDHFLVKHCYDIVFIYFEIFVWFKMIALFMSLYEFWQLVLGSYKVC